MSMSNSTNLTTTASPFPTLNTINLFPHSSPVLSTVVLNITRTIVSVELVTAVITLEPVSTDSHAFLQQASSSSSAPSGSITTHAAYASSWTSTSAPTASAGNPRPKLPKPSKASSQSFAKSHVYIGLIIGITAALLLIFMLLFLILRQWKFARRYHEERSASPVGVFIVDVEARPVERLGKPISEEKTKATAALSGSTYPIAATSVQGSSSVPPPSPIVTETVLSPSTTLYTNAKTPRIPKGKAKGRS